MNFVIKEVDGWENSFRELLVARFFALPQELDSDFTFGQFVRPICLPEPNDDFTNYTCITTGWGSTTSASSVSQHTTLQQISQPIFDSATCAASYGNSPLVTDPSVLCAGQGLGKGSCAGDEGSPLACYKDRKWKLAVVVSWSAYVFLCPRTGHGL